MTSLGWSAAPDGGALGWSAAPDGGASMHEPADPVPAAAPVQQIVGQVLPMYFVGDESHSMSGDPTPAVNQGLIDLRNEVAKHPLIGKKVRFGIITFADTAGDQPQVVLVRTLSGPLTKN